MKTFEIRVPVLETWVFEVEAHSKKEALMIYYAKKGEYVQTHTVSGGNLNGKIEILQIKNNQKDLKKGDSK